MWLAPNSGREDHHCGRAGDSRRGGSGHDAASRGGTEWRSKTVASSNCEESPGPRQSGIGGMRLTILVLLIRCQLRHWSLLPAGSGARMLLRRAPSATRRSGSIWLRLRNRHCAFFSLSPVPPPSSATLAVSSPSFVNCSVLLPLWLLDFLSRASPASA